LTSTTPRPNQAKLALQALASNQTGGQAPGDVLQHAAHVIEERIQQHARYTWQHLSACSIQARGLGRFTHAHFEIEPSHTFGQRRRAGPESDAEADLTPTSLLPIK
jgi:hypothetical protein